MQKVANVLEEKNALMTQRLNSLIETQISSKLKSISKRNVLVVDDSTVVQKTTKHILEVNGFDVSLAENGLQVCVASLSLPSINIRRSFLRSLYV
jgi:PleD family two-component response regulator